MNALYSFIGGLNAGEALIISLPFLLAVGLWLYALIDVLRGQFRTETDKIIWVLVVIFLQALGAIIYLLIGKKQKVS